VVAAATHHLWNCVDRALEPGVAWGPGYPYLTVAEAVVEDVVERAGKAQELEAAMPE